MEHPLYKDMIKDIMTHDKIPEEVWKSYSWFTTISKLQDIRKYYVVKIDQKEVSTPDGQFVFQATFYSTVLGFFPMWLNTYLDNSIEKSKQNSRTWIYKNETTIWKATGGNFDLTTLLTTSLKTRQEITRPVYDSIKDDLRTILANNRLFGIIYVLVIYPALFITIYFNYRTTYGISKTLALNLKELYYLNSEELGMKMIDLLKLQILMNNGSRTQLSKR